MSHTLRKVNLGNSALVQCIIINYVQGGESFTLAELGLSGAVTNIQFFQPWTLYSPQPPIVPNFKSPNLVILEQGPGNEIANQTGINFQFCAIVNGT